MKKIAMLMCCHRFPDQVNDFIGKFDPSKFEFFIHVDRKSAIQRDIIQKENVHFVPEHLRVSVMWGDYSQIEATLAVLNTALSGGAYDYYWLCSGQCFPIKSTSYIYEFLSSSDCNYISASRSKAFDKRSEIAYPGWMIGKKTWQRVTKNAWILLSGGKNATFGLFRRKLPDNIRLYHGSQWWCLNRKTVEWLMAYVKEHPEYCAFFKRSLCPDECFFQTLVMKSPFSDDVKDFLVYVDWSEGYSSPKTLRLSDYDTLMSSDKLLARKIEKDADAELYQKLLEL